MLFWWFAETTAVAGLLAILAAVAGRFRSLGPSARHALWLVVLIKMMTPPIIHAPSPLRNWTEFEVETRAEPSSLVASEGVFEPSETSIAPPAEPPMTPQRVALRRIITKALVARIKKTQSDNAQRDITEASQEAVVSGSWRDVLEPSDIARWALGSWLAASVVLTLGQGIRLLRFRRKLRFDEPPPSWLLDEIRMMADRFGVREPEAFVVDGLGSPLLWCLGRPKLLLPRRLVETLDAGRWRGVLAHEMAHIKRGDPWVGRLELAAGLIWWWNPLYWIVRGRLDTEAELACDAWVVWALPDDRLLYAETVLDICESLSRSLTPSKAPALVLGVTRAGEFFERRLSMIVREHVPNRLSFPALLGAGLLVLVGLPSWTLADPPADEQAKAQVEKAEAQAKEAEAKAEKAAAEAEATAKKAEAAAEEAEKLAEKLEAEADAVAERVEGEAERIAAVAAKRAGEAAMDDNDDDDEDEDEDEDEDDDKAKAKAEAKSKNKGNKDKSKEPKVRVGRVLKRLEIMEDDDDDDDDEDEDGGDDKNKGKNKGKGKGKDKDKGKGKGKDKKAKKDEQEQVEFEFDFSKLGEAIGPEFLDKLKKGVEEIEKAIGPELEKAMEKIGPEIEKAVKEKLGPDFEKKVKDFSEKLEKDLSEKLGPGSDFEKSVRQFAEAFEKNFSANMEEDDDEAEVKKGEKPEIREEAKGRMQKRRAERAELRKKKAEARAQGKGAESKEKDAKIQALESKIDELMQELKKLKSEKNEGDDDEEEDDDDDDDKVTESPEQPEAKEAPEAPEKPEVVEEGEEA